MVQGMVERPILMKGPLVVQTLAGTKTETRRPIKIEWCRKRGFNLDSFNEKLLEACPYGKRGDRLWVRETVRYPESFDDMSPKEIGELSLRCGHETRWSAITYVADGAENRDAVDRRKLSWGKGRPGIHMPRWACRLVLDVLDVKVERVQDIDGIGAIGEGFGGPGLPWEAKIRFMGLWRKMYPSGDHSWDVNPWVWVVKFARVTS